MLNTRLIDQQLLVRHYRLELKANPSTLTQLLYKRAQQILFQLKKELGVQ